MTNGSYPTHTRRREPPDWDSARDHLALRIGKLVHAEARGRLAILVVAGIVALLLVLALHGLIQL